MVNKRQSQKFQTKAGHLKRQKIKRSQSKSVKIGHLKSQKKNTIKKAKTKQRCQTVSFMVLQLIEQTKMLLLKTYRFFF